MAFRRRARTIFEWLGDTSGQTILDCGCGRGFYLAMLEALRPADIRGFLAARAAAGAGNATRARQLAALRAFLRFLAVL